MWSDITQLCRDAAKELNHKNPMINIDGFSLHDAMSAVEVWVDVYVVRHQKLVTFHMTNHIAHQNSIEFNSGQALSRMIKQSRCYGYVSHQQTISLTILLLHSSLYNSTSWWTLRWINASVWRVQSKQKIF
jgi:hypothetical protein